MATQRYVSTSFWDDAWIRRLNTTQKLLYMYLITNPLTNIAGVYQITTGRMAFDVGMTEKNVLKTIEEFQKAGKAYLINQEWIILPNWPKHQRAETRTKIRQGIDRIIEDLPEEIWKSLVKTGYRYAFLSEVTRKQYDIDTISIPYGYDSNYSDTDTDIDTDTDTDTDIDEVVDESKVVVESIPYKTIIDHLNLLCQTNYKASSKTTQKLIRDRWNEGFRVDDFKSVIRKKSNEWLNTEYSSYLRPQTLFGTKFESYLNQLDKPKKTKNQDHLLATMAAVDNFFKENADE